MKSTLRQGFTLVELLFVMAIIAILAGFAIANLKGSSKTATVNSMKNDARNAIAVEQTYFAENQVYDSADCSAYDSTGNAYDTGKCQGDDQAATGTPIEISVSKGNEVVTSTKDCGDGTTGFTVDVTNNNINDSVTYDSCTNGKIVYNPN